MAKVRISNNKRFILNIMSDSLMVFGVSLLPSIAVSLLCGEDQVTTGMGAVSAACMTCGLAGRAVSGKIEKQVRPRIWYMTTFFTWILLIAVTVPVFFFGIPGYSLIDAVLEASASWTTTGIGIYDTATLPLSLQLCRSTCNWLGGVGILMTVLMFVPPRQYVGWGLVSTEFPGPSFLKSEAPFRKGYRKVVLLYMAFTLIQFALLLIAGMPLFTSVLTALSNSSTSGLQHINNGVATALSGPVKAIITIFAFLGSVNCMLFLLLMDRKFGELIRNSELRFYFWRILLTCVLISGFVWAALPGRGPIRVFADVLMQTISFVSTSGYIITDCHLWPPACMLFILLQMFIGSCALSTGGGIKVARIIIALKTVSFSIYRHIHPRSVRTLTFNRKPMTNDQVIRANLFIALFMITYLGGALLLSFDNMDIYDALNYSQAMITNTGTSIGELEAPGLAEGFTSFTKLMMCLLMIAGRLEIYPFVMIFLKNFWRSDSAV